MCIAQGRLRAQNAYCERTLRLIESQEGWSHGSFFSQWHQFMEQEAGTHVDHKDNSYIIPPRHNEAAFVPNFAILHHRKWWAGRMKLLPWLFGIMFGVALLLSVPRLCQAVPILLDQLLG
jgi:hypothetical protein